MTEEEFDKRVLKGDQLWILDDMVLDLSNFMDAHPGGVFVLAQNIGRDISKFFYGAYSLDGNIGRPGSNKAGPYVHSNIARKIANQYAIAVLDKKSSSNVYGIRHSDTKPYNKTTCCYQFNSENRSDIPIHYPELETLGKHFLVRSNGLNGVPITSKGRILRRHYTITNCMRGSTYQALLDCINQEMNAIPDGHLEKTGGSVACTIKNYNLQNGLSHRFFDDQKREESFHITGPMGKGLLLTNQSEGLHIAFGAGTGVLVFMDLVARLVLQSVGAIPKEQCLSPNFKLILFASF